MSCGREQAWRETHCSYCGAVLRSDGGCSMWHGEPHDLPYLERKKAGA